MISDDSKAVIDTLSKEELRNEINRENRSRFQGDKYSYLQTRLAALEEQEKSAERREDNVLKRKELFLRKVSTWVAIATSVFSLVVGGGWYQEYQKNQNAQVEANVRLIVEYLQPIATLLTVNESIFRELRSEPYSEPGWGILESYLIKIQRDGVAKHALMKKRIDTLVQNNEAIITLLTKYIPYIKTEPFRIQSEKFLDHAIRYRDRWQALLEVFASNGDFPTVAPVFPGDLPKALQSEIAKRKAFHP